jgi:hypothetical protein
MRNHVKYAISRYPYWISIFSLILGIIAILPIEKCLAMVLVAICFSAPFLFPFVQSYVKTTFELKTSGKTDISFAFGDLFQEDCFVVTTNNYYDIIPDGNNISPDSLLGIYINNYCSNLDKQALEAELKSHLQLNSSNEIIPANYGDYYTKTINGKIVYFLVFTDRQKEKQPKDFYIRTLTSFFNRIVNENHGKRIALPLIGNNNNLSDTGFTNSEISFISLMTMINCFEITNQRSTLKLKIISPEKERANLVNAIAQYMKID